MILGQAEFILMVKLFTNLGEINAVSCYFFPIGILTTVSVKNIKGNVGMVIYVHFAPYWITGGCQKELRDKHPPIFCHWRTDSNVQREKRMWYRSHRTQWFSKRRSASRGRWKCLPISKMSWYRKLTSLGKEFKSAKFLQSRFLEAWRRRQSHKAHLHSTVVQPQHICITCFLWMFR